jgi:hypothetical protein
LTIRDVNNDFGYQPPTSSTGEVITYPIVGGPQTYLAPNVYDATSGGGAFLTELTVNDTILCVPGGFNFFMESGTGQGMRVCIDWTTAPQGSGTIDTQLITCASPSMSSPTVMIEFGALPVSQFYAGLRQLAMLPRSSNWQRYIGVQVTTTGTMSAGAFVSWIGLDFDSEVLGYAEGFSIK